MFDRMRIKFALYFMFLVLILHFVGAALSIGLFHASLERNMDTFLNDLLADIKPSVQIGTNNLPTLSPWAEKVDKGKLAHGNSIQVYGPNEKLIEQYGPPGIDKLAEGTLKEQSGNHQISVRSQYEKIVQSGKVSGYLQVQASTDQNEKATRQAIYAALLVVPLLGALVTVAGYVYAGIALKPVNKTMQLLRRFVADAGHELNTPIAIIEASLETLQELLRERQIAEDLTEVIGKASSRMNELASDLVFLARVEDPVSAYPVMPVNIKSLIEEVVESYSTLAKSKNIQLKLLAIPNEQIPGKAEFLRRMLSNLISNSMRYTDVGGSITVSADIDTKRLQIKIADTGIGMDPDCLDKIFDRFYRADKARARAAGGAGLGLSIVKAVVEGHKGGIEVESKLGEGSTFIVTIPI